MLFRFIFSMLGLQCASLLYMATNRPFAPVCPEFTNFSTSRAECTENQKSPPSGAQNKMAKKTAEEVEKLTGVESSKKIDFDNLQGEVSTGKGTILELEVGQIAGPLTITRVLTGVYLSDEKDAKPVITFDAKDETGAPWRLPVGAIFVDKMTMLGVCKGDVVFIRRENDVMKEKGRGKGRPMQDYTIKVTERNRERIPYEAKNPTTAPAR